MSRIPCDTMSTIIHPFEINSITKSEDGTAELQEHECPECGLVKLVYFVNGRFRRSDIVTIGKVNTTVVERHGKLSALRD